jgi:anti-anti-sigma factor
MSDDLSSELEWPEDTGWTDAELVTDFAVDVVPCGSDVVLAVRGEIDMASRDRLWSAMEQALSLGSARLIVDLSKTTFMDSTGIGLLLQAHGRLQSSAGSVVVRSPSTSARNVLDLAGITHIVTIEGDDAADASHD